jgi:GNAT superfamily N-acetyltransferase
MRTHPITLDEFDTDVAPLLRADPVVHQVPLALAASIRAAPTRHPLGVRLLAARAEHGSPGSIQVRIQGICVQTPPYPMLLALAPALDDATADAVALALGAAARAAHPDLAAVTTPEGRSAAFARGFGVDGSIDDRMGLFALREPVACPRAAGAMRPATKDDAQLLQEWMDAFHREALPREPPCPTDAGARLVAAGRTSVWVDDGRPVAFANNGRRIEGWWSVGPVYTPPELRGRGYATSLVEAWTRLALAEGAVGCTLFTDLANPTSNRIYERIGYRRVANFERRTLA